MIARTLQRAYGSAVVAAHLPSQARIPYWPREKLEAARDRNVRRIATYAARHVPHYRDLFAREGIDARDIKGAADLSRLPLIDRENVRAEPHRFQAATLATRRGLSFLTSGSTGRPLEAWVDRAALLANLAYGERERAPVNRLCGNTFRPKELYVGYETSTFKKVIAFYEDHVLFPARPRRRFVSLLEPIEHIAALTRSEQPDILVGYGGWIDLFFKTVLARNIEIYRPKLVMYMGEALPHGARDFIEQGLGMPVMSRYNAVEAFKIGFYCECRTGFHLHEDICHVRIVGSQGRDVPAGDSGEIVISNLINRATVLLNYPMGDMASLSDAPCPCGRTLRQISELEGRTEDILPLIDGRHVHPRAVWQLFKADRDILQYQLTQVEPRRFRLTLVTTDEEAFRRAAERVVPALERLLEPDAQIETARGTGQDRAPGTKYRAVASLRGPSGAT